MADPICATGCASLTLPAVTFDNCAPEVNSSEIEDIFVAKADAVALTDWEDPSEWATRLSQSASGDKIRRLTVVGDKPATQVTKKTISKQRDIVTDRAHTINFDVDETNDDNYEAMRQMQCGGTYRFWYKTRAGKLYGGPTGILASFDASDVLGRGDEDEKFQYVVTWKNRFDPERVDSPI